MQQESLSLEEFQERFAIQRRRAGTICSTCAGLMVTCARVAVMGGTIFTASVISMSAKRVGIKRL